LSCTLWQTFKKDIAQQHDIKRPQDDVQRRQPRPQEAVLDAEQESVDNIVLVVDAVVFVLWALLPVGVTTNDVAGRGTSSYSRPVTRKCKRI
jgi:hypothetical protein